MTAVLGALLLVTSSAAADEARACARDAEEGQRLAQEAKLRGARERFLACARETCPPMIKRDCGEWLARLQLDLPSVVVDAHDAEQHDLVGVKVTVDGDVATGSFDGTAFFVDPGLHVFRFEAEGRAPVEEKVMIRQGEKNRRISVVLSAATAPPVAAAVAPRVEAPVTAPRRGWRVASFALAAAAIVFAGLYAGFGVAGLERRSALTTSCAPRCEQSQIDAVRAQFLVADVSLGVTLALAGLATAAFLVGRPEPEPASPQLGLSLHPGALPDRVERAFTAR